MTGGRPLRFVALVGLSWTTIRIALLWQQTGSLPEALRQIAPIPRAIANIDPGVQPVTPVAVDRSWAATRGGPTRRRLVIADRPAAATATPDPRRIQMALLAMTRFGPPIYSTVSPATDQPIGRAPPPGSAIERFAKSRLSFSSWMIARAGTGLGVSPTAPQLGGTQGGIRADYAIGSGLAVTGRLAVPAAGAGREASLGIAWRPAGVPLRFVAEQRLALDGGRGGPALGVSGGVNAPLPAGFSLEGYGQAGAILRSGIEHYVDGSARIARPLADLGGLSLDIGAGAWGGAQRGVARVDVGPSVGVTAPIAGRAVRLSVDWRQRVAGSARPGSGPALSVGSDF